MREVRVAGGGLAGLALAAGLRRHGVPVVVDEAGSYPRHRVCGEFVSGVSAETLEGLGIARVFDDALRHRSVRWFVGGREVGGGELPAPALGISRFRMDRRLRDLVVAAGGEVREGSAGAAGARRGTGVGGRADPRAGPMGGVEMPRPGPVDGAATWRCTSGRTDMSGWPGSRTGG